MDNIVSILYLALADFSIFQQRVQANGPLGPSGQLPSATDAPASQGTLAVQASEWMASRFASS